MHFRLIKELQGHSHYVTSVKFSPDGTKIVSASYDKTVRIWDVKSGTTIQKLDGHVSWVNDAGFSPDGSMIVSCSNDNTVRIWNVSSGLEIKKFKQHQLSVMTTQFSPDGTIVMSSSLDATISLWKFNTNYDVKMLTGHSTGVRDAKFSPDGQTAVSSSYDQVIGLWSVQSGQQVGELSGFSGLALRAQFSPDGLSIVSGATDGTICIWNANSKKKQNACQGHSNWVTDVKYSPNGRFIVSCSHDETIRIWDTETGQEIQKLEGHTLSVTRVDISPDCYTIESGNSFLTENNVNKEKCNPKNLNYFIKNSKILFVPFGFSIVFNYHPHRTTACLLIKKKNQRHLPIIKTKLKLVINWDSDINGEICHHFTSIYMQRIGPENRNTYCSPEIKKKIKPLLLSLPEASSNEEPPNAYCNKKNTLYILHHLFFCYSTHNDDLPFDLIYIEFFFNFLLINYCLSESIKLCLLL
ncbi:hypothetical protein RFI_25348 [Reticulomyxa filosa]|uniref:Uncharacterized protein n=1 Tax=Reticulomyxa filosa TaxID=46433 RepID=X6MDC7_RETFI|nr:hypothetical protein RFI_25348 [Reticulomyxa filosa]|eukprot:ETO12028.1 hypothetical protein RFI_25348 [Reticulomyxa filosa]